MLVQFEFLGLPRWLDGKESTCQCRRLGFDPWVRKIPWCRKWLPTPVFLPGKFHKQRSLVGYSPCGCRVRHDLATKQQQHLTQSKKIQRTVLLLLGLYKHIMAKDRAWTKQEGWWEHQSPLPSMSLSSWLIRGPEGKAMNFSAFLFPHPRWSKATLIATYLLRGDITFQGHLKIRYYLATIQTFLNIIKS